MSEVLLCGDCPFFPPCHIGVDVDDDHCWISLRDRGLPFVYPEPEPEPSVSPVIVPEPKRVRTPGPKRIRTRQSSRRDPEEVRQIRIANLIKGASERYEAHWRNLFGDGPEPPIRSNHLVGRPDLWTYAADRVAAGRAEGNIRSELAVLGRLSPEVLQDPARTCYDLGAALFQNRKSALEATGVIRRYRRILDIDLTTDEAERQERLTARMRALHEAQRNRLFADQEPLLRVRAIADRPDIRTFAERALAAGYAESTVKMTAWKCAHYSPATLADPAVAIDTILPADGTHTTKAIRECIDRFRRVMEVR
jgi:hypothetical protein